MRYVSLTFDDGRDDNYNIALPIMSQYGFTGTVFCTTGYIDGSWSKRNNWYSISEALRLEQLLKLKNIGWELGIHGDKHITETGDTAIAIHKFKQWGLCDEPLGYSIPDSSAGIMELERIVHDYYPKAIRYIRGGRARNTRRLTSKILFGLYTLFNLQFAYYYFNKASMNLIRDVDLCRIFSIVIRCKDSYKMVLRFIDTLPDGAWVVFMLHSVLPEDCDLYMNDTWCWSAKSFDLFCRGLHEREQLGKLCVRNMRTVADIASEQQGV